MYRWILVGWMFVISAIAYLDRVNLSIAGRAIEEEFHFSDIQLGYVLSAFVLGYALFQAPGGRIADRFGPRLVLSLGVVWWAVFTVLITLLSIQLTALLATLIVIRFALGIGEAVVYPSSNCVVSAWIPSTERGIANGIIFAGVGFGAGVTPRLIVYFLEHGGWRASFWASASIGLAAGAIWFLLARDKPRSHPWVSPEELAHIESGLPKQDPKTPARMNWGAIFSNRDVLAVGFAYFCFGYTAYIFLSWFFIYLNKVRGLDLKSSSYYSMLPFLAMAAGSTLGGWLSDSMTKRFGKRTGRCKLASIACGLAAVFVAMGTQVESAKLASFVLAAGAGALYLAQSSFWSVSADIGKSSAGSVSGVINMGAQIGGALTSSLTPWIAKEFGWTASFLVASILCLAGAATWLLVEPDRETPATNI
jgi:ACS family glucarate transporter-like MFS transporter